MNKKYILLVISIIILFLYWRVTRQSLDSHYLPDYEKENLSRYHTNMLLNDYDYDLIYHQTGLGKPAVDVLRTRDDFTEQLIEFQTSFFTPINVSTDGTLFTTRPEQITDANGVATKGFTLAPLENGYVLITKASSTLGWRNGHAGLIVNAEEGFILEAIAIGENSKIKSVEHWTKYPSFIMLRLKQSIYKNNPTFIEDLTQYARLNLVDIPYRLSKGISSSKKSYNGIPITTNCSHIIWSAFEKQGIDIDSDGGFLVTPYDITQSELFEIIQIYGVNPDNIWN